MSAPTITVSGGLKHDGTPAKIIAIIGNSVVRSNLLSIKFDRTSGKQFVTELSVTEKFVGSATRLQFPLTWAPDIK